MVSYLADLKSSPLPHSLAVLLYIALQHPKDYLATHYGCAVGEGLSIGIGYDKLYAL